MEKFLALIVSEPLPQPVKMSRHTDINKNIFFINTEPFFLPAPKKSISVSGKSVRLSS
jgi:hypothetical protein